MQITGTNGLLVEAKEQLGSAHGNQKEKCKSVPEIAPPHNLDAICHDNLVEETSLERRERLESLEKLLKDENKGGLMENTVATKKCRYAVNTLWRCCFYSL